MAQNGPEKFWRISALVSKMGQVKKIAHIIMYTNWSIQHDKVPSLFFIWHILQVEQKSFKTFRSLFGQWSFMKKWFWDLLTFKYPES